jgi:hypothetical protein
LPLKHGAARFLQNPGQTDFRQGDRESEAESEMEMSEAKRERGAAGWRGKEEDRGEMREKKLKEYNTKGKIKKIIIF